MAFAQSARMSEVISPDAIAAAGKVHLRPFGAEDMLRYTGLLQDILRIFSNPVTFRFVPARAMLSAQQADAYLQMLILRCSTTADSLYFLHDSLTGKVVGVIELLSPETSSKHYALRDYPHFIEFYLDADYQGSAIMTSVLPQLVGHLKDSDIGKIGAAVDRRNLAAAIVLQRSGFKRQGAFDVLKDLYLLQD